MGKLVTISFAGIDDCTNPEELRRIEAQCPMVEWGVLCSQHWQENGNRYLNPKNLHKFEGLKLSAHLCGSIARWAMNNYWNHFGEIYPLHGWRRAQLNVANVNYSLHSTYYGAAPDPQLFRLTAGHWFDEIIIQQSAADHRLFDHNKQEATDVPLTILLDDSGGQGKELELRAFHYGKVGYAGGINPGNVVSIVKRLTEDPNVKDFWIDMETGVRTEDWFDTDKVNEVLDRLAEAGIINKNENYELHNPICQF